MKYNKQNPLRVVTLCSGYDSQCLALNRLKRDFPGFDYELIAWSEYDPETPNKPLEKQPAVIAHNALFPQWADRNLGDMTKIDWTQVPDFDLLFYSTPCFVAGTLVLTSEGYKPIEDVKVGDMVLTHTNNYRQVLKIGCKMYKGELYSIKGMSSELIQCTDEHPFYARKKYYKGHKRVRSFKEPEWIKAKELTKDYYLGYAIDQNSTIPEWNYEQCNQEIWKRGIRVASLLDNTDFWYVMGRYVGDGWIRDDETHHGIVIACSERNTKKLEDAIENIGYNYCLTNERTCSRITINNKELCEFAKRYGRGAENKVIDSDTMRLPISMLEPFVQGYLDSDGCYIKKTKSYQISTISRKLAVGFGQCVAKVYHKPYKIYKCSMPSKTVIEGRVVNQKDFYIGRFKDVEDKQDHAFYEDGYIWFPISSSEHSYSETMVYNLEVEEDNSYTANGAIVHNCQSISNAGLQHGFTEGSGTRSSIIWNVRDAVKIKRPKYLCLENVKAMVSKKFLPMFNLWQQELAHFGYMNFAQVLNAKDYGVAQNRERIFLVSIRDDGEFPTFSFPQPFPLEKKLKDYLEPKVDEKYYLSDKMLEYFQRVNDDDSHGHDFKPKDREDTAFTVRTAPGQRVDDNFVKE